MDRTLELAQQPFDDPIVAAFAGTGLTIVAGSVWPADLQALAHAWPHLPQDVRIILAPHQLHEEELARTQVQWNATRYTQTTPEAAATARVLLLDTIGMLSRIYRYGEVTYIGGAFRTGLHNTLEPLAYGLPVIFGPQHHKFPEAAAAIAAGGAWSVASGAALLRVLQQLLEEETRQRARTAQLTLARQSAGASTKTVDFIVKMQSRSGGVAR
jgi:3-deoxy-D-manno-octulosonic-acid transferase